MGQAASGPSPWVKVVLLHSPPAGGRGRWQRAADAAAPGREAEGVACQQQVAPPWARHVTGHFKDFFLQQLGKMDSVFFQLLKFFFWQVISVRDPSGMSGASTGVRSPKGMSCVAKRRPSGPVIPRPPAGLEIGKT